MDPLAAALSEQINISPFNKLRRFDTEVSHKFLRHRSAGRRRLLVFKNDFQFEELSQPIDAVEVHAGSADHEQRAMFTHAADRAVGQRQRLAQGIG